MLYTILRHTVAGGRLVLAGEVVALSSEDAAILVPMGKAVPLPDVPPAPDKGEGTEGPLPVPTVDGKPAQKRRR